MSSVSARVAAWLKGVATGDAVGKQTEGLSPTDIASWYPSGIRGWEGTPGTVIPRYKGNSKREWLLAEVTDDTERTLAIAHVVVAEGRVSHRSVGRELLACRKCVHPGINSLWEFHRARDPDRTTDRHDGCGAAVRVGPIGILYPPERLTDIASAAREASIPTHGGPLAIAAAAAVAAAVSAAVDGGPSDRVRTLALEAAALSEKGTASLAFSAALNSAFEWASSGNMSSDALQAAWFPDRPLTIVPVALALGTSLSSAEAVILLAANIGGDADSVASIAGGIAGALHPDTVNEQWVTDVEAINRLDLAGIAMELAKRRT